MRSDCFSHTSDVDPTAKHEIEGRLVMAIPVACLNGILIMDQGDCE
jgi:hypothetical protein